MGRGRQKAKQTKVARELKYFSPHTDYRALERELASRSKDTDPYAPVDTEEDDEDGGWPTQAVR
jgi:hypothetical protein